jgi:hypothetical protein
VKYALEICPSCGQTLEGNHLSCAACGWTMRNWRKELAAQQGDPDHGCCAWRAGELRCRYPATLGQSTTDGTLGYCRWHFGCTDPVVAARIVEESQAYRPETLADLEQQFDASVVQPSLARLGLARQPTETQAAWIARMREFCRVGIRRLAKERTAA